MPQTSNILTILILLAVVAVVFLLGREFVCWYWKVNERKELLIEIRDLLKNNQIQNPRRRSSNKKTCPQCHSVLMSSNGFCNICGADI